MTIAVTGGKSGAVLPDPDPAVHFDADLDLAFHFDAYTDPVFHVDADADPDPAFQNGSDPSGSGSASLVVKSKCNIYQYYTLFNLQ